MIDVVWPGAFAPYLVDLKPKLGAQARLHAAGIIANDTVGGHLVAMPWFGDFGILYYRTDLLKKYGYKPADHLDPALRDGEEDPGRRAGANPQFSGFVFQGNGYEGLTCDALEWIASSGGGQFIEGGKATINNPKAAAMLDLFRKNIGVSTPRGVTSYQEGETHTAFVTGNAAFMRNWPYAYSIAADPKQSKVVGKFSVTTLPHGPGGHPVGTVGGWQLAVNKYSKHQDAAIEFVRYMTSPAVEKFDAITNTNVPTIPAVAKDPAVVKATPYLKPHIERRPRHAPGAIPGHEVQRGLEGHLPGDQPDPQRQAREGRAAEDPVPAAAAGQVARSIRTGGGWRLPSSPRLTDDLPRHSRTHAPPPPRSTKLQRRQTRSPGCCWCRRSRWSRSSRSTRSARPSTRASPTRSSSQLEPTRWVGLENYRDLWHEHRLPERRLEDRRVHADHRRLRVRTGLAIALVVNSSFKGRGVMRAVMLVPWAIPTVVAAQMWKWMLDDTFGVVNDAGMRLHILSHPHAWISDPSTALAAVCAVDIWKTTPFVALLLLAGLQVVCGDLYEAAEDVDGASQLKQFYRTLYITLHC